MIDKRKKDVVLQWLACCGAKVVDFSELESGMQFLELLSKVDPDINIENIDPSERLQAIENSLCALHSCLPHHFLVPSRAMQKEGNQLTLATTAVLVLSALFVRAASPNAKHSIDPVMALEEAVQEEIKELLQIVTSPEEDVLQNLQSHLQVQSDEESPIMMKRRLKRKKDQSFTFSPSVPRSPLKRMMASPVQPPQTLLRNKEHQIRRLRQQLSAEEMKTLELERELTDLRASAAKSSKEIASLKSEVQRLRSTVSTNNESDEEVERLQSRVTFLNTEIHRYQVIEKDYDEVIRENSSLKAMVEEQGQFRHEILQLKTSLSEVCAEKINLEAQIAELSQIQSSLEAKMEEKNKEVEAYREFWNSKNSPTSLPSPIFPGTPVKAGVSYFTELCHVELEETKGQLETAKNITARLEQELRAKEVVWHGEAMELSEQLAKSRSTAAALARDLSEAKSQIVSLKQDLATSKSNEGNLEFTLQAKVNEIQELDKEILNMRCSFQDVCNSKNAMEKVVSDQAETIAKLYNNIEQFCHENDALKEECRQLADGLEEKSAQILLLESTVTQQCEEMSHSEISSQALKDSLNSLQADNAKLNDQLCTQVQQNFEKSEELSRMEFSIRQLNNTLLSLQQSLKQTEEENSSFKTGLETVAAEKLLLEQKLDHDRRTAILLENQVAEKIDTYNALCIENEELQKQVDDSHHMIGDLRKAVSELNDTNCSLQKQLETALEKVETVSCTVSSLESSLQEKTVACKELKSMYNTLQNEVCSMKQENEEIIRSNYQLSEQHDKLQQNYKETKKELESIMIKQEELKQQVQSLHESLAQITSDRDLLQNNLDDHLVQKKNLDETVSRLKEAVDDLTKRIHEKETKEECSNIILENLSQECSSLRSAKELTEQTLRSARQELEELSRRSTEQGQQLEAAEEECNKLSSKLKAAVLEKECMEGRTKEMVKSTAMYETNLKELEGKNCTLQAQLCQAEEKYEMLVKSSLNLQQGHAMVQHSFEEAKKMLDSAENECSKLKQNVHHLRQTVLQLTNERNLLQTALADAEAQKNLLGAELAASSQTIQEQNTRLHESSSAAEQMANSLRSAAEASEQAAGEARAELESLKAGFRELQQNLKETEGSRDKASSDLATITLEKNSLQESLDKLESQHQTLCDQFSDVERKLKQAQEMHNHSEEEYFKCVEEKEKQKEELNKKIEDMTRDADEQRTQFEQLAEKYEELEALLEESELKTKRLEEEQRTTLDRLSSATRAEKQIQELKPHLSSLFKLLSVANDGEHQDDDEPGPRQLQMAVAKCESLKGANEKLTAELKKEKQVHQEMTSRLLEFRTEVEAKLDVHDKARKDVIGQRDQWKRKYEQVKAFLEKREAQFSKLTAEMKKTITGTNADMQRLKAQIADQCSKISQLEDERDRAVCDNYQLSARLRDERFEKAKAASSSSCSEVSKFRVPAAQRESKRDTQRPHNTSMTQAAAVNSSIFSDSMKKIATFFWAVLVLGYLGLHKLAEKAGFPATKSKTFSFTRPCRTCNPSSPIRSVAIVNCSEETQWCHRI